MFPQQVQDLHKAKAAGVPAAQASTKAPVAVGSATAASHNHSARKLFVTVEGLRHDVTIETLEG
jgi:hypothetical protein